MKNAPWRFDQPPSYAVSSGRDIVFDSKPMLFPSHGDGAWQFLTGDIVREDDAAIVASKEVVELDKSVLELTNMPGGWIATRRAANPAWEWSRRR